MAVSARSLPESPPSAAEEDALIARWIERPSRAHDEARLQETGTRVSRVISRIDLEGGDRAAAARAYALPAEAVEAALAYYRRHKEVIDARITLDRAWWEG